MEINNTGIEILTNSALKAYSELKTNIIADIKDIQQLYKLNDVDMQTLLGLNEKDFSSLMDERLYYVLKVDTIIRVKLLNYQKSINIPELCDGINVSDIIEYYKVSKYKNSICRLLETIGVSTADEINLFTDKLSENVDRLKKEGFLNKN